MINDLDYKGIEFPVSKKNFSNIEEETKFVSEFFFMKTN